MPPAQGTSLDEFYKILLSSLIIKTDFYYFGTNYNIYNPTIIQEMIAAVEKMESVIKDALKKGKLYKKRKSSKKSKINK